MISVMMFTERKEIIRQEEEAKKDVVRVVVILAGKKEGSHQRRKKEKICLQYSERKNSMIIPVLNLQVWENVTNELWERGEEALKGFPT